MAASPTLGTLTIPSISMSVRVARPTTPILARLLEHMSQHSQSTSARQLGNLRGYIPFIICSCAPSRRRTRSAWARILV